MENKWVFDWQNEELQPDSTYYHLGGDFYTEKFGSKASPLSHHPLEKVGHQGDTDQGHSAL